jgi:hypothetical protein
MDWHWGEEQSSQSTVTLSSGWKAESWASQRSKEVAISWRVRLLFHEVAHNFSSIPGVVASVGGIPNLVRRSPAMGPYLLAGLPIPQRLLEQHVFTTVVQKHKVLPTALEWAARIVACSPDAVWVTKEQINLVKDGKGINEIVRESMNSELAAAMYDGENLKEGLRSFVEVRFGLNRFRTKLTFAFTPFRRRGSHSGAIRLLLAVRSFR